MRLLHFEDHWIKLFVLDDESLISANLGNDHDFIKKKKKKNSPHWSEAFWEVKSKTMRVYTQSEQYHTIMESRVRLTLRTLIKYRFLNKVLLEGWKG